jgi:predicted transcriptional regulator
MTAILWELQEGDMNTIVPAYPAQIVVSQAEVKLLADETANASAATIKSDQQRIEAAQQVEAAQAKSSSAVDFVT